MTEQIDMDFGKIIGGAPENLFYGYEQIGGWVDEFGTFLRLNTEINKPIKTLSLFAGAGGLDIGFFDAGFEIIEKVEIEKQFIETLKLNTGPDKYFPTSSAVTCIDIRDYQPSFDSIDFIIGGPPCQSFSAAGARASGVAGTRDDRGNLFREYVRLLKELKPKAFLFENVYRIVGANGGRDWQVIIKEFSQAGYQLHYRILDTADYGVPQHRERLIIVGTQKGLKATYPYCFPRPTHGPDSISNLPHFSSGQALSGATIRGINVGLSGKYGHLLSQIPPGLNYSFFTEKMGHPQPIFAWRSKFSDFLYKAGSEAPVRTIKAMGGQYTGPFHWDGRAFSVSELKRLQTFPDDYEIAGKKLASVKQIGNSVPPQFARILALSILEQVFHQPIPMDLVYLSPSDHLTFRKRKRQLSNQYKVIARKAISQLHYEKVSIQTTRYKANLTDTLRWEPSEDGKLHVDETISGKLLKISVTKTENIENTNAITIKIEEKSGWNLSFDRVELKILYYSDDLFTSAWKAFEYFLSRNNIKADLVQLSGYYQNECSFRTSLYVNEDVSDGAAFFTFLQKITEGVSVNVLVPLIDLSTEFSLSPDQIIEYLFRLKHMGFEVRSSTTNDTVPKDFFILPYHFPTLTEKSVQRTKRLY